MHSVTQRRRETLIAAQHPFCGSGDVALFWLFQTGSGHSRPTVQAAAAITGRSMDRALTDRFNFVTGHSTVAARMVDRERLLALKVKVRARPKAGMHPCTCGDSQP
jgi:hypothetical protein